MNRKTTKRLIIENICLLIPLILYGLYKNGYLIYIRKLTNFINIFKNIYLVIIALLVKIIYDLIKYKKINFDYDLVNLILVSMVMPYNINILVYTVTLIVSFIISDYLQKYFKFNRVCFIILFIVLINGLIFNFSYLNPIENKFTFSFTFFDYLFGKSTGGISSTSIIFSFIAYIYLVNTLYYKKDIPLVINIVYLFLGFIYYLITKNDILLNSELIFSSIFIATLPKYSPSSFKGQIIYSIVIGILSFILYMLFNNVLLIYLAILLSSCIFLNID